MLRLIALLHILWMRWSKILRLSHLWPNSMICEMPTADCTGWFIISLGDWTRWLNRGTVINGWKYTCRRVYIWNFLTKISNKLELRITINPLNLLILLSLCLLRSLLTFGGLWFFSNWTKSKLWRKNASGSFWWQRTWICSQPNCITFGTNEHSLLRISPILNWSINRLILRKLMFSKIFFTGPRIVILSIGMPSFLSFRSNWLLIRNSKRIRNFPSAILMLILLIIQNDLPCYICFISCIFLWHKNRFLHHIELHTCVRFLLRLNHKKRLIKIWSGILKGIRI